MPNLKLPRKRNESMLITRWLWDFHRTSPQWRRVRLGPFPTPEMGREYMVTLRWADAIYIDSGKVYIVEAKLKPGAGAIGQLEHYRDLFRQTPEFDAFKYNPIELILLTPKLALDIVELCSKKGIKYEHYRPKGWDELEGPP